MATNVHNKLSLAIKDCLAELHRSNEELKDDMNAVRSTIPAIQDGINKIKLGHDIEQNDKLLAWISSSDFPSQLSDIIARRQAGTGQWFLESPEFNNWISGREKTLFCPGIPGAGKTMISAIAVDHLHKTIHDHCIGVAYVFCNYKVQSEQNTVSLLSSILKQLLQTQPAATEAAKSLYELHSFRKTMASVDEVLNTLKLTLKNFSTVYIVVDALDERHTIDGYVALHSGHGGRIQISAKLEVRASPQDVTKFVKGQIPRLHRCVKNDNDLQGEIEEQIVKAVDGMFLLARLHVDSLLDKTTKSKVRSMLKRLSSGEEALNKAYDNAIKRIEAQPEGCSELAKRVLTWISYAERPLTIEELRHALAVNPGDNDLDRDYFEDMEDIVSFCAGLVTVDDKSNIVRLVHYTTQEYFLRIRQDWNPTAQEDITTTCLTYLAFEPFKTGVSSDIEKLDDILDRYILFDYACQHWAHHAMPVQEELLDLALVLLKDIELVSYLVYSASDLRDNVLSPTIFPPHRINATGVHIAAKLGLQYLLRGLLIGPGEINGADVKDDFGRTPLSWAALHRQEEAVMLLVERADVNADSKDKYGRTPLSRTAERGHASIVKLLAERDDVDADSKDNGGQTPSSWAGGGYGPGIIEPGVVELLVYREDVEADSKDDKGQTPLSYVATALDEESLILLKERVDVDINSKDNMGLTPLMRAAKRGRQRNIEAFMMQENVDVNLRDNDGHTALWWAEYKKSDKAAERIKSKISPIE
ncbi:hypothetical protein VE03_04735 [Pseudogymnoascus sp. 23342-1-I1]|nr:hypothetical protein VE03_04735 [Pseudogymnoascus sp. 23342-1-I1]